MKQYEWIFWDNDGVLVDTEKFYFQANKDILAEFGFELTIENYREWFLTQNLGAWHVLEKQGVSEGTIQDLRNRRNSRYRELLGVAEVAIDGAEEVLDKLYCHTRMAIVTSSEKQPFNTIHSKTKILEYIEFVVGREMVAESKPDPEPYLKAISISGADPSKCLVIEDSERGLIAAKAAGLDCWVIPTELSSHGNFSAADKVLQNISEIPALMGF